MASSGLLCVDLGGTNARFALYGAEARLIEGPVLYRCEAYESAEALFKEFRKDMGWVFNGASICVAGPALKAGNHQLTNRNWDVDANRLGAILETKVQMLNDLEAHAYGVSEIRNESFTVLKSGEQLAGNQAVIAVGTGLGEAFLVFSDGRKVAVASEGGHTSFSPTRSLHEELLKFLRRRYDHVSWERVLSGQFGFRNLHDFFNNQCSEQPYENSFGTMLHERYLSGDEIAKAVIELFCELYACEAANFALKINARGGVFLCGKIANVYHKELADSFDKYFSRKGRFSKWLEQIPVFLVTETNNSLSGCYHAFTRAKS